MSSIPPAPAPHARVSLETPRRAPVILWRAMEALLRALYALFGDPADVAHQHTFTREAYKLCADWVRAGEAMLRRLLLIEAAACAKPNTQTPSRKRKPRAGKLYSFAAEAPENWRVSFRVLLSSPVYGGSGSREARDVGGGAAHSVRCTDTSPQGSLRDPVYERAAREASGVRGRKETARFRSAWPLAERYEAMLRVFNEPAPYAQRLARKLYARPRCVDRFSSIPHTPPAIGREQFDEAQPHVRAALRHFDTS